MTPRPQPVERLEKRLARVARDQGLDQERLRRWVSFLALCGVLERALQEQILDSYFLKGGVALELRFATRARATKDLDLGLEGPRGRRVDLFQRVFAARATHSFPLEFVMPPEWRPEVEALAAQLGFAETRAAAIEERFREVVQRINEAASR